MKQILTDFLVLDAFGLYCKYGDFYIDPNVSVRCALVSHGHGDHASPGSQLVYCTSPTYSIMKCRYGKKAAKDFNLVNYYEEFFIREVKITFISAGHILGSAQILLEYEGVKYLYTGDYKIQADPTCEAIDYVAADVLITESTFANPTIKHPDVVDEIKKLNETPYNILLGTYGLGKAQRLTHLINTHCPDKTVLLHYSILPIHKIYEEFGINGLHYKPYDRKIMKQNDKGYIYLVPPLTFKSYFRANLVKAFASGWEYLQRQNDISLYISDHVDWDDILNYITRVNPTEIWTVHGDGRALKEHFKEKIIVKVLNSTI